MRTYESICLGVPKPLLPRPGVDLTKWAAIACDQFTSEPEYWQKVSNFVGRAPSTLNLIYPEVYLGEKKPEARIARIRDSMKRYLAQGIFEETEGIIYVERKLGHHSRKGLMACLNLDHYDYQKGATSLIRASEGTILERIPPRVKIREGAPIELPHIMVLIDDPGDTVIGPITENKGRLKKLYDFELMMNSGRLRGYQIEDAGLEKGIVESLEALARPENFAAKYNLSLETPVLLYAMGDGNHSLATAKTIWEKAKAEARNSRQIQRSPLRYAMVELVNLHDDALAFEPIHRVIFGLDKSRDVIGEMQRFYSAACRWTPAWSIEKMKAAIDSQKDRPHKIGIIAEGGSGIIEIGSSKSNLPAGTLQNFLDAFLKEKGAREIDYVHGHEAVVQLGRKTGNTGFYLPAMKKQELFRTVILDGALPRKTFSMGEAWQKRFYMEARKLQ
jgi:uncharacterized protein (DUF1015 family)